MAHLYGVVDRSLLWLAAAIILSLSFIYDARADYSARVGYSAQGNATAVFGSQTDACIDDAARHASGNRSAETLIAPFTYSGTTSGNCFAIAPSDGATVFTGTYSQVYYCGTTSSPSSVTSSAHTCTGSDPNLATCSQPSGTNMSGAMPTSSGSPAIVCLNNCTASPTDVTNQWMSGGVQYWKGTWTSTGDQCTSQPTASSTVPANDAPDCQPGYGVSTVGGITMCVPASQATNTPTTVNSTSSTTGTANGSGTSTGSTTTTETKTCTGDGSCSTSTTTVTKDGSGTTTGTTTTTAKTTDTKGDDAVSQFCRENPTSPICKGSSWGGSCAASFTCEGDAVQCAQAQAAYLMACDLTKTGDQKTLGDQITSGTDPLASTLPNPATPETKTISITSSGFLGGGGLADQSFTVWGQTVTLPFSSLNVYLGYMGSIMLVCASLACARIVGVWG